MKIRFLSPLLLFLSLCVSHVAYAGGVWSGVKVLEVKACTSEGCPPKGRVVLKLSAGAIGSPPSCSSSNRNYVVINVDNAGGGLAAQIAQSAKLMGATISVDGTGNCGLDPAIETASSVTASE